MPALASITTTAASGPRISLDTDYRLSALIKEVPGARFTAKSGWRIPFTLHAAAQLYDVLGPEFVEFSPELAEQIAAWKAHEEILQQKLQVAGDPAQWTPTDSDLYPFQKAALDYALEASSAVLAYDMGLGKSIIAVEWSKAVEGRTLVVCPKGVQSSLLDAWNRWDGSKTHILLTGTAIQRRKQLAAYAALTDEEAGVLIISYAQLALHSKLAPFGGTKATDAEKEPKELNAITFQAVVVDEAHRCFNPKAKQTRALWSLVDNAERVLALTGTPVENSPLDAWALLRLVNPEAWPSRSKFMDRYCEVRLNFWGSIDTVKLDPQLQHEFDRLKDLNFARLTKATALPNLPKKVRIVREVELPPKLRKQYDAVAALVTAETEGGDLSITDPMTAHTRLVQAASATLEVTGSKELEDGTFIDTVRLTEPSPKLDALEEILEDMGEQPVAIFARSRQLLDLLSARFATSGRPHTTIVGGMAASEIGASKDAYNDGAVDTILVSLGAGSEGFSLTRGSTEVFLDRSYRELENAQAEDRLHGIGRGDSEADSLTIIELITTNTVEERRREKLDEKQQLLADMFDKVDK